MLIGFFLFLMAITTIFAYQYTLASYVIAVKRSQIVMGVIAGYLFFKEENIREKLAGSILIFIGVAFVILFQ